MWFTLHVFMLLILGHNCNCTLTIIRDLIQFNIAGHPVLHKDVTYDFDPDVGIKRAREYQELNGVHGEKAIERLGLGIDGKEEERLAQQKIRDRDHLGGFNNLNQ